MTSDDSNKCCGDGLDILMSASGITSYKKAVFKDLGIVRSVYTLTDDTVISFDNTYSYWMRMLYLLIFHISKERENRKLTIPIMKENPLYQFFGLAENACDQLMYFFVKDELSGCNSNKYLDSLCFHLLYGPDSEIVFLENTSDSSISSDDLSEESAIKFHVNEIKLMQMRHYMKNIICDEFNAFITGEFYDFYNSFWSGFEATINVICKDYENDILSLLQESKIKAMRKLLEKLVTDGHIEEKKEQIALIESLSASLLNNREDFLKTFGPYISLPDKYNYLLKHVIGNRYIRDRKRDVEILAFGGAMRNTIHNNGVHLKANKSIEIGGYEYHLVKDEVRYSDDYADVFLFCQEIFDIYVAIVDGMEKIQADVG